MPIRVSIIEDDRATREGFMKILQHTEDIVCIASYATAEEALLAIPAMPPDVLLSDINLPGRSGIECVGELKSKLPQLQILMLTVYEDADRIFESLRAGASGFLLKRSAPDELVEAIREVSQGGSPMSAQIARKVVTHFHRSPKTKEQIEALSNREKEILDQLATGIPYKLIAEKLGIATGTVHAHLHNIYGKLHVQSRTEAVVKFLGR